MCIRMINFVKSLLILIAFSFVASSYPLNKANMDYEDITINADDSIIYKKLIPCLHLTVDAYSGDQNKILKDNEPIFDTKYRTLKRNADLINSMLALPKGMSDAGR